MSAAINAGVYMQSGQKGILCLCHDTTTLQVRQLVLERFGYKVWPTSSIEDATNMVEHVCPDMLLMDHGYPGMDAERLAAQMKRRCPGVIAVVLSPFFAVRNSSRKIVDRYVADDEEPNILIAQLQELFEDQDGEEPRETATI